MANRLSPLDANQVIKTAGLNIGSSSDPNGGGLNVYSIGGTLVPEKYNDLQLTYVAAGNGVGEVETVTYFLDATEICTLTLTYDASNRITRVQRTNP